MTIINLTELKTYLEIQDDICMFDRSERGLYSTKKIKKDDIVIKIKRKYLLEYNYICKVYTDHTSFKEFHIDFVDKLLEVNSLVAYYLYKLKYNYNDDGSMDDNIVNSGDCDNSSSFDDNRETIEVAESYICIDEHRRKLWLSYIDNLPEVNEYINYWDKDDMQLIDTDGSTLGYLYNDFHQRLQQDALLIYSYFHVDRVVTFDIFYDSYLPLRLLVGSRIFGYACDGISQSGIVPYVDMTNHALKHNTRWYFCDEINCFVLQATCNIDANSEILEYYGHHCNCDLLLYYGFTVRSNPHVKIVIDLSSYDTSNILSSSIDKRSNNNNNINTTSTSVSISTRNNIVSNSTVDYPMTRIEINHDTTVAHLQITYQSNYNAIYNALLRLYNKRLVDISRMKIKSNINIMNIYLDEIRLLAHILDLD